MTALDNVMKAHGAALLAYATRLTRDPHLAEDVVQETWLRAWRHVDRLEDMTSVRAWLKRVAHNVAIDQHRNRRARPAEVELSEPVLETQNAIPAPSEEVETRMVVDAILDRLPTGHRHALVQVYFADRTATSAAANLGIPVGTVKSRVHKALRTLRDRIPQAA